MCRLDHLFENNRDWAARCVAEDPSFFARLAAQQAPQYLWIGCSDSRVPANQIAGLQPGEVFVHRNIANLVVHSDLNFLSVLQYAVEVLKVTDIMVVGHYRCGGVQAVAERRSAGLVDNWLKHIEDIAHKHADWLDEANNLEERGARLAELNVVEQVANVCRTTIMRHAWYVGHRVTVHGLIYEVRDGLLRKLGPSVDDERLWQERYKESLEYLKCPRDAR
ncbi:MAG: carbonate dehydratase [Hyphomicrobiales bacterium]|nr:carbonate dehydratase [Hyphomicrobiales bacterium]